MLRRYSKQITGSDIPPGKAAATEQKLPKILKSNLEKAAANAHRRAVYLAKQAEKSTSTKDKDRFMAQSKKASEIADEMLSRSLSIIINEK